MKLAPYSDYRENGLRWLPRVPDHWKIARTGRLFRERVELGFPDLPDLEVSLRTGVRVRDLEGGRKQAMADRAKSKRARAGDIAFNIMRMWQGAVGIAPCDGLISPAYIAATPTVGTDARYFVYLFRTSAFMREVEFASRGIVPDRNRLYWDRFKPLQVPQPPPEEQRRIADFLDAYTAQVHRLLATKRRVIAGLSERKQGIIDDVFQPTGDGWRQARLKNWCHMNLCSLGGATAGDLEFDYFDISTVGTGTLAAQPQPELFSTAPSRARRLLEPGDVMISTVRTYLKAVYRFAGWPRLAVASTGFAVLTPVPGLNSELLAYAVMSPRFINEVIMRSVGVAYPAIAETSLASLPLALPTASATQRAVVDRLHAETREVDEAIAREQQTMVMLQEYRDTVVAAIVTGALDVRAAEVAAVADIAELPDSAVDEPEPEDALEAA